MLSIPCCTATDGQSLSTTEVSNPGCRDVKQTLEWMLWMKVKHKFYQQLQQLVGAYSRDWREATDVVQRTAKLADSSSGSGKGATIRQEEWKASPETRHTAVFTLGLGNTSNPPLGDKEISLTLIFLTYSERKRWILTSGGSKSSTQCAHLTKKVSGKC